MELNDAPTGVAHLLGARVHDTGGHRLGRVNELRGRREDDGTVVVEALLLGPRGLWKRMRGPGSEATAVPLEAVVEVSPEVIVVRSGAQGRD